RFAGAVGADQAIDFAGRDLQMEVFQGDAIVVLLAEVANFDHTGPAVPYHERQVFYQAVDAVACEKREKRRWRTPSAGERSITFASSKTAFAASWSSLTARANSAKTPGIVREAVAAAPASSAPAASSRKRASIFPT